MYVYTSILASTQVELTVQQRPSLFANTSNPNLTLPPLPTPPTMNSSNPSPVTPTRPINYHHSAPARDRITGPQPVDVCIIKYIFEIDT